MVRVITQETFDSVVKENMDEFEMSREEAIKEAIEQFQSQGVELSNIVTTTLAEDHPILKSIQRLKILSTEDENADSNTDEVKQLCDVLNVECAKGLAEKMLATNVGAYETLVSVAEIKSANTQIREAAITALASLLDGNPDPLDESGFKVISETLSMSNDVEQTSLAKVTLGLTLNCCVRHEQNRQNLVRNGLLGKLDVLFGLHPIEVARVWQSLVQDDDVRVPYGKAHDHAREIVEEHQALKLVDAVKDDQRSPKDIVLLLSCLSSLCVRNEYCQAVVDKEGLTTIFTLLINPDQKREVVKECLNLLKVLAGNDNVKRDIAASNGIETIINAISKHVGNSGICKAGCSAITALCLRTPENCKQVMEAGGAQAIVQVLKTHMDSNSDVLNSGAAAIRNIVCRSKEYCKEFVDLDIEQILHEIMTKYPDTTDGVKAALRDLELKVNLKEEWRGDPINVKSSFQQSWD